MNVYRNRSTGWQSLAWTALVALALALAGCTVAGTGADPCASGPGCQVPAADPVPAYLPLCEAGDQGPCVEGSVGAWYYRHSGARQRLAPCATEQGGIGPCVWVPSAMGSRDQGDMGAYLWGTGVAGFPLPSQVEPS